MEERAQCLWTKNWLDNCRLKWTPQQIQLEEQRVVLPPPPIRKECGELQPPYPTTFFVSNLFPVSLAWTRTKPWRECYRTNCFPKSFPEILILLIWQDTVVVPAVNDSSHSNNRRPSIETVLRREDTNLRPCQILWRNCLVRWQLFFSSEIALLHISSALSSSLVFAPHLFLRGLEMGNSAKFKLNQMAEQFKQNTNRLTNPHGNQGGPNGDAHSPREMRGLLDRDDSYDAYELASRKDL